MPKDNLLQSLVLVVLVLAMVFLMIYLSRGNDIKDLTDYIPFVNKKEVVECVDETCPEGYYCNIDKGVCKKENFLNRINFKDIDIYFKN